MSNFIFKQLEENPFSFELGNFREDLDLDEIMCIGELVNDDNIFDDSRARDAQFKGKIKKNYESIAKEYPHLSFVEKDFEIVGELNYDIADLEFSEAFKDYQLRKLLKSPSMNSWLDGLQNQSVIEKAKITTKNIDKIQLQEVSRKSIEAKNTKNKNKIFYLPTGENIINLSHIIIDGLRDVVENNQGRISSKWGFAITFPSELQTASEFALYRLECGKELKMIDKKYEEYEYKGYRFYTLSDPNTITKIKILWADIKKLTKIYREVYNAVHH